MTQDKVGGEGGRGEEKIQANLCNKLLLGKQKLLCALHLFWRRRKKKKSLWSPLPFVGLPKFI